MSSLKERPEYWRSLAEYENDPEFLEFVKHEFAQPMADLPPNSKERRRFMQVMGASIAFASATGCRWQEDHLLPHATRAEGVIPGVPRYFNSGFDLAGVALGTRVKSYDGRPIKIDGNPNHPDTDGASGIYEQAGILEMYDPDRSRGPHQGSASAPPKSFDEFATKHFAELKASRGAGLRVLSGRSTSVAMADVKSRFLATFPEARWVEYEPVNLNNADQGARLAFGSVYRSRLHLERARVVVTLDADLFGYGPGAMTNAKGFAATREPEAGSMSRMYSAESRLTLTGMMADHRLPIRSGLIKAFAVALAAELGAGQAKPDAQFLADPKVVKLMTALVGDLRANAGRAVVAVGANQPPEVHAVAHAINAKLGAVGATVTYHPHASIEVRDADALAALSAEMEAGSVNTLLMLETNPVYTAPGDVPFAAALAKVKTSIHAGIYRDETGEKSTWHVPLAHHLEAWGDVRAIDGTVTIAQPIIAPLYGAQSAIEMLATLAGDSKRAGLELVQRALGDLANDKAAWRKAVHDGVVAGSASAPVQPPLQTPAPITLAPEELGGLDAPAGQIELSLVPCSKVFDGRYANNGWLQELPDPVTKLTWDNALLLGPGTAAKLGVDDSTLVTVTVGKQTITVPALLAPGQAPGSACLALGYGRTSAGRVGGRAEDKETTPVIGVDAYPLRSTTGWDFVASAVKPTRKKVRLATTQDLHAMDQIGRDSTQERLPQIVRGATFAEFQKHPDFAQHVVHHPPLLSLWEEPVQYDGRKWGLSVDLNKCTGCNACVVACNAENNVSIVGKSRVLMGREMHWMRIDRYYTGDPDAPRVVKQPMMCQHCEHAPCEQVCPVGATMHSEEGLNDMTYNRCIGTRYCSNNCPYKVRRFNYFNLNEDMKEERNKVKGMAFNPEVTVRSRGVMEKCTYCVQRINTAKIQANNEGHRPIRDGEVTTACQDTCPTGAIVFGDMNDSKSRISAKVNLPRSYEVLGELNNRPRTRYLATVRNPHPELG